METLDQKSEASSRNLVALFVGGASISLPVELLEGILPDLYGVPV